MPNTSGQADEVKFLAREGVTPEMLFAGARRVQDQCGVDSLSSAASIAREVWEAMNRAKKKKNED